MTEQEKKELAAEILKKIEGGEVKMRPKTYFIMRSTLYIVGLLLLLLFALFLVSFIAFIVKGNALAELLSYGGRGWQGFIFALPWLLILLVVLAAALFEAIATHYAMVYKRPLIYSCLAVVLIVVAGGVLLASTTMHHKAFDAALSNRLPVAGALYRHYGMAESNMLTVGMIVEINLEDGELTIKTRDGKMVVVHTTSETKMPPEDKLFIGLPVGVIGERDDNEIEEARGVRPFKDRHLNAPPGFEMEQEFGKREPRQNLIQFETR